MLTLVETGCPKLQEPASVILDCKRQGLVEKCVAACKDNSVFVTTPKTYTCTGDGVWTPSDIIPDCVLEGKYKDKPV